MLMHIFFYVHAANDNKYLFYDTLGRSKGEVGERQDFSFFDLPKSCRLHKGGLQCLLRDKCVLLAGSLCGN